MSKQIYIRSEIISWESFKTGSHLTGERCKLPHNYLSHDEKLIAENRSSLALSDAIINLNRAVNHRITLINKLYKLKKVPDRNKPKGLLDQLSYFGIIKPLMLNKLYTLRNTIEHHFSPPPKQEQCAELAEFVWYLIRLTDPLTNEIIIDFELEPADNVAPGDPVGVEIKVGATNEWEFFISGRVPNDYIVDPEQQSLEVTISRDAIAGRFEERAEDQFINGVYTRTIRDIASWEKSGKKIPLDLSGKITGTEEAISSLVKKYFETR